MVISKLTWDEWNITHISRHDVTKDEIEEVCLGEVMTSETYNGRFRLIGSTGSGRVLTIIIAP